MSDLKKRVAEVMVFEKVSNVGGGFYPAEDAQKLLPGCQVALLTATALINRTIDGLLSLVGNCREVVILGSSTPLMAKAFAGTPVTQLSGIIVTDPDGIQQVVSEGGGTQMFKGLVKKVNCRL